MSDGLNLAEIEQIKQLKARYFRLLDTKDWDAWADVFAPDVIVKFELSAPRTGEAPRETAITGGRGGLVAQMREYLADTITVHHGHMPEITITAPDMAAGIWSMEDIVQRPGRPAMYGYGHYHEQYRKEDGAWRIARLHLTRLRVDYRPA